MYNLKFKDNSIIFRISKWQFSLVFCMRDVLCCCAFQSIDQPGGREGGRKKGGRDEGRRREEGEGRKEEGGR